MALVLDRCPPHSAAREPGPAQFGQRVLPRDEGADAGRVSGDLVKREGEEVRLHFVESKLRRRKEGGGVEQYAPALPARLVDQPEWMTHTGEVRLRWKRQQGRSPVLVLDRSEWLAHPQLAVQVDRPDVRARLTSELPDAIHRVVIVSRRQQDAASAERKRLADQPAGTCCLGRANDAVLVRRRAGDCEQ